MDVVSCWEAFFDYHYKKEYGTFFFDRFPNIPVPDGNPLTPDFTAYFTKEYAIIFEISRTFPRKKVGLKKEMNQLFTYDKNIPIYNGKTYVDVDNYDIILLLSGKDSFEITNRISKYMEEENEAFNHNFIVLEYNSNYTDRCPYYYFRKIPLIESGFTDFFPDHINLFKQIDEKYKSLKVKIEYMKEYKINGVLCNDNPPPAYLAGFLWHKIFYMYMDSKNKKLWKEKNPRLIIPLEVDIDGLKVRVEKSIKNGKIRMSWIRNVLDFFVRCGLAIKKSSNRYEIKFRNLYPTVKTEYRDEYLLERTYQRELSIHFIERFCSGRPDLSSKKEEKEIQRNLNGYL